MADPEAGSDAVGGELDAAPAEVTDVVEGADSAAAAEAAAEEEDEDPAVALKKQLRLQPG